MSQDLKNFKELKSVPSEKFFDFFLQKAIDARASDVHFEPTQNSLRVRFRIDGELTKIIEIEKLFGLTVLSKIKLKTNLRIDEQFLPQDGRLNIKYNDRSYDVRVSTLPTLYGEDIVLRIFNQEETNFSLNNIGLSVCVRDFIDDFINLQNGLVLISGATGSGKTTTLYSILQQLIRSDQKIISIEDPVEYKIDGVCQIAVNDQIGLSFANILRSVLRQAPNIIMVGEIRDKESADLVVQAALTGHLVLSTVHADTAHGALIRLKDFEINDFLIKSTLRGVISQRLLVKPCKKCSQGRLQTEKEREFLGKFAKDITLVSRHGCDDCLGRGYCGRTGLFELIRAKMLNSNKVEFAYVEKFSEDALTKLKSKNVFFDDVKPFLLTKN